MVKGDIRVTSVLPMIEDRKPLLPLPILLKNYLIDRTVTGDITKIKKLKYITPEALDTIVKLLSVKKDVDVTATDDSLNISTPSKDEKRFYHKVGILVSENEKNMLRKIMKIFEFIGYVRSRIDRINGAADIFYTSYVMPLEKLYFIVFSKNRKDMEVIHSAVKLLEELGIGGGKFVGLGKFQVLRVSDNVKDLNSILPKYLPQQQNDRSTYWVSMGKYVPDDNVVKKYYEADIVAGVSGGITPYKLPLIKVMLLGTTISTANNYIPRGFTKKMDYTIPSLILFNPLFYKLPLTL